MSIKRKKGGYTLIELIVSIGLFSFVMLLTSGVYLMMIGIARQAQGISTGINNLSFALETMTRTIRTGKTYGCPTAGTDCTGGTTFSLMNVTGKTVTYSSSLDGIIMQQVGSGPLVPLTDSTVTVTSLTFYASGTAVPTPPSGGDYRQPHVTIIVSGTVSRGPGKPRESFTIETGATMRGTDI